MTEEATLFPAEPAPAITDVLHPESPDLARVPPVNLPAQVQSLLGVSQVAAELLIQEARLLYIDRMTQRFSELRVAERLKRTNPFLLQIRGAKTVRDWAKFQVESALYASEEEAVGHLLEEIAMICFPGATTPSYPDDFDFEVSVSATELHGYQVKMSWDCMPMSSRKNLSNTIGRVQARLAAEGKTFVGFFASCYGKAKTTQPPGQAYVSLSSREFWERVGDGNANFDVRVGEVCALLCAEFRVTVLETLVPTLLDSLTTAALPQIGNSDGTINYVKLFRRINR
jgi:Type II restriction endonuclease EcoO109I